MNGNERTSESREISRELTRAEELLHNASAEKNAGQYARAAGRILEAMDIASRAAFRLGTLTGKAQTKPDAPGQIRFDLPEPADEPKRQRRPTVDSEQLTL